MALCPFADQLLLPESDRQPNIVPRLVILHSAAGKGSLYKFFRDSSNLESHFWVGEDGTIEQYIDTRVRADANLKANPFAVSIETESSREATERWGPAQAAAIVRLVRWLCDEHRIPKRKVPTWDGSGIGWHIQFGAPGPWTPVSKSCPGPARVIQARDEIIPAVAQDGTEPKEWDEMATQQEIADAVRGVVRVEVDKALEIALSDQSQHPAIKKVRSLYREVVEGNEPKAGTHQSAIWKLRQAVSSLGKG
jgi:N-acetyl-anhydromuramyl-L-alanine amidase AmpD